MTVSKDVHNDSQHRPHQCRKAAAAGGLHNGDIGRAAHGYELTPEAAMAAFAKGWRAA
jgi:hypothetical protein